MATQSAFSKRIACVITAHGHSGTPQKRHCSIAPKYRPFCQPSEQAAQDALRTGSASTNRQHTGLRVVKTLNFLGPLGWLLIWGAKPLRRGIPREHTLSIRREPKDTT